MYYSVRANRHELSKTILVPLGCSLFGIFLALMTSNASKFVGFFAVLGNIVTYASPLSVVKLVVETRSVKYMPLMLSVVGTGASIIWTAWAACAHDRFVLVPNVLGIFLGLIQLAVYAKYYKSDVDVADLSPVHPFYATADTHDSFSPGSIRVDSVLIKPHQPEVPPQE